MDGIYYRLYNCREGYVTVVCMQSFDEYDYKQEKFARKNGKILCFDSEEKAISYLNDNYDKEDIDPEYFRAKEKSGKDFRKLIKYLDSRISESFENIDKLIEILEEYDFVK